MTNERKNEAFAKSQHYVRCLNELHKIKALKELDNGMYTAIMAMVKYTIGDMPKAQAMEIVNNVE